MELRSDGEPIGTSVLPVSSRIAAADLGRIWVLERDELDVEGVVRYAVEWP